MALAESPLPPCPETPNCVRESHRFSLPPDALFTRVQHALSDMGPAQMRLRDEERRVEAVFRVVFFKDDVAVAVAPHQGGSVLHIRSASRTGEYDFGVNGRRVKRFFRTLETMLQGPSPANQEASS